jgi:hypothetical protein
MYTTRGNNETQKTRETQKKNGRPLSHLLIFYGTHPGEDPRGGKGLDPPEDLSRCSSSSSSSSSTTGPFSFKRRSNHRPTLPLYQRPVRIPSQLVVRIHSDRHLGLITTLILDPMMMMRRQRGLLCIRMKRLHPIHFFWVTRRVVEGPLHGAYLFVRVRVASSCSS